MNDSHNTQRPEGVLLGAAAGDALGWPQELRGGIVGGKKARREREPRPSFRAWTRNGGNRFSGTYHDPVEPGAYSDDTQLICALSRSYLRGGDWFDWFSRVELPAWRVYQRGGGRAVLAASGAWSEGRPPWRSGSSKRSRESAKRYLDAGGNGAAMRVAPHVLAHDDHEVAVEAALLDATATHGHPRALLGSTIYVSALSVALSSDHTIGYGELIDAGRDGLRSADWAEHVLRSRGFLEAIDISSFLDQWDSVVDEVGAQLDLVERAVHRGSMANDQAVLSDLGALGLGGGAGTTTAVASVYLATRGAARPLSGLLAAAFADDADTDTLASMVGGILGAIHGSEWLGDLASVQDASYLRSLARSLSRCAPDGAEEYVLRGGYEVAEVSRDFLARLPELSNGARGIFPDGREYEVSSQGSLRGGGVRRIHLNLSDGQTVQVDSKMQALSTPQELTPVTQKRENSLIQVTIPTQNLVRALRFYSGLTLRDLTIVAGVLKLTDGVVFVQGAKRDNHVPAVTIDVRVADLEQAASFLRVGIDRSLTEPEVRTKDPDGVEVRVRQLATAAGSTDGS